MGASFGADLPAPGSDRIVVYLLGPGVGESQVVVFPDGRCMVVDCCSARGVNLPERLLRHLGKKAIDLLVITHPDLDHIEGLAHLVSIAASINSGGQVQLFRGQPALLLH